MHVLQPSLSWMHTYIIIKKFQQKSHLVQLRCVTLSALAASVNYGESRLESLCFHHKVPVFRVLFFEPAGIIAQNISKTDEIMRPAKEVTSKIAENRNNNNIHV
jgi:hypothetical protein